MEEWLKDKINFEYDVKCRRCGKIVRLHFASSLNADEKSFKLWVREHSTYPIEYECKCGKGMIMLHDIVAFGSMPEIL